MSKLVSIIVLTYRKFDDLERNLTSIKMQNHPNYEVIIQDDGSPNFDRAALEALVEKIGLENVKIETNPTNLGTVKSCNRAIRRSSGEIIMPLSQDDAFIDERVVSDVAAFFEKTGCLFCTAKWKGADSGRVWPAERDAQLLARGDEEEVFCRACMGGKFISGCCTYYAREIFDRLGAFDEEFYLLEDRPFYVNAWQHKVPIAFLDRITILYGEDGVSSQRILKTPASLLGDAKLYYEKLIFPNLQMVKNRKIQRRTEFIYSVRYGNKSKGQLILQFLKYLDIVFLSGFGMLLGWLLKDDSMEYRILSVRL